MINQLGMVNMDDTCFILEKRGSDSRLYGPYDVTSEPFYDDTIVWRNDGSGREKYRYKVQIARDSGTLHYVDIFQLTDIIHRNNLRLEMAELKQYNVVVTLLPKDQTILENEILRLGQEIPKRFTKTTVTQNRISHSIMLREHNGRVTEAFAEYLIMKNKAPIFNGLFLTNQFRLSILQDIVDIIGISKSRIAVVEVKSKRSLLTKDATRQNREICECRR